MEAMRQVGLYLITVFACLSVTPSGVAFAQGADLYVKADATGAKNGTSWDDALTDVETTLDWSLPGDEIWVAAGTYRPSRRTDPQKPRSATFQLKNDVAIYGGFAGTETDRDERDPTLNETILSGDLAGDDGPDFQNNGENAYNVVTGSDTDETAVLDGFTITAGNANGPRGVTRIFSETRGGGMFIENGSPTIAGCTITQNWESIAVICGSSPKFRDCTISLNSGLFGDGILLNSCGLGGLPPTTFTRCTISGNQSNGVIAAGVSVTLVDCIIEKNGSFAIRFWGYFTLTNCTVANNLGNEGVFWLSEASSLTLTNCVVWGNANGSIRSSTAQVSYSCIEGARVWRGEGNINQDPLFCGWKTGEVLVENQKDFTAALTFNYALSPASPCIGTGEGGVNMGADTGVCETPERLGRTVLHLAPGTYKIGELSLDHGVSIEGAGAGETVLVGTVVGLETGAVLSNLTVTGGTEGGIVVGRGESPEIRDCTITGNTSDRGGGVRCFGRSSPTFTGCVISGNSSDRGGGVYCDNSSSPTLTNCVISGNAAAEGGGLQCSGSGSSPMLMNCTISGNSAEKSGGGINCKSRSSPTLTNCIIWDNVGGSIEAHANSNPIVTFSCVEGDAVWPGDRNFNDDPLFVSAGDYHLGLGSPAIDSGTSDGAPATDMDGNERPCGGGVDMGAYEHCESTPAAPLFLRGDCNGDATVNISDATCTLSRLFVGGRAPGCIAATDVNGDEAVNIADPISLLNFLFAGGPPPVQPFPECGPGNLPGDEKLGCENLPEVCQ